GEKATLTADEEKMLADGLDGKLSRLSLAEAVLVADGTEAAPRREACLDRIALLQKQARAALARARTPAQKAEQLLRWLHAGAMKKGYQKQQSSLAVLLESGKYNCVSSAALYVILARRLGLDVRAVEAPEHAFAVLHDAGREIDVETTSARGFE